ncbi:MAG: glycerol-3-phosphate dehydrogenase/oxidase [Simkaniaceae bacterium]
MKREKMLQQIQSDPDNWDLIIIGGGATGLGAAVDAAARGYRTLLLEQNDFAKATSSRSTKLIHGGLRYLQQGNIQLVVEALKERGLLCRNAPHLISHRKFLVPNYHWWEGTYYGFGLKIYDLLAGKLGIEKSKYLSKEKTKSLVPTLAQEDLRGSVVYYDGQFDDARLAITLAKTFKDLGGVPVNYMPVTNFIKRNGKIRGVKAIDLETDRSYSIYSAAVINATGIFIDQIRKMDDPASMDILAPSQGVHIVVDQSFMPSQTAILIPHTEDKRVVFIVPWHQKLLIGTTDTPILHPSLEPRPFQEEIEYLLKHASKYLSPPPKASDILSCFAGIRPLLQGTAKQGKSSALSRDHAISISPSNLISISGGKWTTYRKMGEDVIDKAIKVASLPEKPCRTKNLHLHGYATNMDPEDLWSTYGSNSQILYEMMKENPKWGDSLHKKLPYLEVEVVWAARYEMARSVEDVLSRRTRSLLLDARASLEAAPRVAKILADELGYDEKWQKNQVDAFTALAKRYCFPLGSR